MDRMGCQSMSTAPDHSRDAKEAYVCKSGWIWRFSRSHRKWVKRWGKYHSKFGQLTFLRGPWKGQGEREKQARSPRKVVALSPLKLVTDGDKIKRFGFVVEFEYGRTSTLCCDTSKERDEWVEFLTRCLESHVTLDSRYDVHWQAVLGSGAYAEVVLARDRISEEPVAVKMVTQSACRKYFDLMDKEVQIMSMTAAHPYLLGMREAFYSDQHIYIVTDLLEGGDLTRRCTDLEKAGSLYTEQEARNILRQILKALDKLHQLGISHCDIKPENVMFTSRDADAHVKLIDYNSATFFCEPVEPGGTPEYMAPELLTLRTDAKGKGWDSALDMWAIGILLCWMLTGRTPFQADTLPHVLHKVQNERLCWSSEDCISPEAKDLISSLLDRDASARPSASQAMNHIWFTHEKRLTPMISLFADSTLSLPSVKEPIAEPILSSILSTATISDMEASTPKHLCVRIPRRDSNIKFGFAASTGFSASTKQLVIDTSVLGLRPTDSVLTLDSLVDSPDRRDPMDSCMSVHRELAFRSTEAVVADAVEALAHSSLPTRLAVNDSENEE